MNQSTRGSVLLVRQNTAEKIVSSQTQRILVIDDDVELCQLLTNYLAHDGFKTTAVHNGSEGLILALSGEFALVILDLMLPGMDGTKVLSQIRSRSGLPVIMLSARGEDSDRIMGLEGGADDYVPKPFNPRELAARIRAVLRRALPGHRSIPEQIHLGDLEVNLGARLVRCGNRVVELTSVEFDL